MKDVIIRKFEWEKDYGRILEFQEDLYKANYPNFIASYGFFKGLEKRLQEASQNDHSYLLVAENNKMVIAFIWLEYQEEKGNNNKVGLINQLYVVPRWRNRGVSELLIQEGEKFFKANLIKKTQLQVASTNIAAYKLYKKIGFQPTKSTYGKRIHPSNHQGGSIMFLEGNKVYIRSQKRSDIPKIVEWKNDSEIADMVRGAPIYTNIDIETKRFEKSLEEFDPVRLIIESKTGEQIGLITLSEIDKPNQKAEIGMLIGEKSYWHKGYGTDILNTLLNYLFSELDFNRISLEVFEYNTRAKSLYEKIGFEVEGVQREGLIKENGKYNIYLMGILKDDFFKKNTI